MSKLRRYDGTPSKKKFYGFNYYIQCNDKLSKTHRNQLLTESKSYLGLIYNSSSLSTEDKQRRGLVSELDSSLTDLELLEIWNPIYEEFGYMISEFKDKWELKQIPKDKIQTKNSEFEKSENLLNELRYRIVQLEILNRKSKYVEGMG
jgi:DNA repair ATPase RecN